MVDAPQTGRGARTAPAPRHAPETTSAGGVWLFVIGMFVGLGVILVALRVLVLWFGAAMPAGPPWTVVAGPTHQPHVQQWSEPASVARRYRRQQAARLSGYGWIDREHAVVRIPIERAMELIVEADP